jgi:hypothetical protein
MTAKRYNVILNGKVWYSNLTEKQADAECIRARNLGLGMAYVVRI